MKPTTAFPSDELMALFLFGSMMNHIGVWRRSDGRLTWMIRYPDPCFALPACSESETEMSETLQLINSVFQQRGYLVFGTHDEYAAGEVVDSVTAWDEEVVYQKLAVLSLTDENDFLEQGRLAGGLKPKPVTGGWTYYYRVTCE